MLTRLEVREGWKIFLSWKVSLIGFGRFKFLEHCFPMQKNTHHIHSRESTFIYLFGKILNRHFYFFNFSSHESDARFRRECRSFVYFINNIIKNILCSTFLSNILCEVCDYILLKQELDNFKSEQFSSVDPIEKKITWWYSLK